MIGLVIGGTAGGILGANGYTIDQGVFWAVLIPVCIVGTAIDVWFRS